MRPFFRAALAKRWKVQFRKGLHKFNNADSQTTYFNENCCIIYIYMCVCNFNLSINCIYTISNNTVTFLDLQLTIDSCHIISCVHFKPTDSHNYLLFSSSQPPSCKQSIPFSLLLRIKRCCSDNVDVITISNQVANYFSARQYPKHIIESVNENVHSIHREDILMPSSKTFSPDRIPLILSFHPSIYPSRRIILKH